MKGVRPVPTSPRLRSLPRRAPARSFALLSARLLAAAATIALATGPALAAGAPAPRKMKAEAARPASMAVSYADLIDQDALTRTGRKLGDVLRDPGTSRALLQPFLDGYSSLLPYVVEMVYGADAVPRRDVLERWPGGTPRPGWVAIFDGGAYRAVADAQGRVRLFLPGDDAAAAWREHYPVVRHCLAALAPAVGAPVSVEIFAYRNDYRKQELRLSLRPVTVDATSFPPDRARLDLSSLDDFFRQGGRLEGALLNRDEGLVLFADPQKRDALAGEPLTLADFAVAYRAAFHAGDNAAFISLDPNADPGAATVNFGGFLQDTRVGAAVLAADRRFKTVCSGLDPISHRDIRAQTRAIVPTFMTNSERSFLQPENESPEGWVTTRYWFYPESIRVDADPDEGLAVITRPRFTADAERTGKGFESVDSRRKRAALEPGIRENIKDINANYARYAAAFPEIGDLESVARLMAIATWLKRSKTSWLDLDALLAVELPALATPRTVERIISTEFVAIPRGGKLTPEMVRETSGVTWLNPMLERSVGDFFGAPKAYAAYLCAVRKAEKRPCSSYEAEAATLFDAQRDRPLRSLFPGDEDLLDFLEFLVDRLPRPLPPEGEAERAAMAADKRRIELVRERLGRLAEELRAAGEPPPETLVRERDALDAEIGAIMKRYHEAAGKPPAWRTGSRIQVTGGISLRPEEFTIRAAPRSESLKKFRQLAQTAAVGAGGGGAKARLVRSRPTGKAPREAVKQAPAEMPRGWGPAQAAPKTVAPPAPPAAPRAPKKGTAARAPAAPTAPPPVSSDAPARVPTLAVSKVTVPAGAVGATQALGELGADGRIVFRKVPR